MNEQGTDNSDEARKDNDGDTPNINGFPLQKVTPPYQFGQYSQLTNQQ